MTSKVQQDAMNKVNDAIRRGELVRPESCELCGRSKPATRSGYTFLGRKTIIVAHHHNGYDHPMDIWFICQSCNVILGKKTSLTKEQAREYVEQRRSKPSYLRGKKYSASEWEQDLLFGEAE